jgi:crossover junction endodeoxyribonuclease RuvC
MGIDCGTAIMGWAVLESLGSKFTHVDSGAIITPAKTDMSLRLKTIYAELSELLEKYQPDDVALEDLFFFKNSKTVISVSQARGVAIVAAANQDLRTFDYTPLQVKMAVTGYGRAEKDQVEKMVMKIVGMTEAPKLDDTADAIAVAICHLNSVPRINT